MKLVSLLSVLTLLASCASGDELRLNQIQVIGTHNSYHIEPMPAMMQLIGATNRDLPQTLQYTHRPLPEQFGELGMRQIELDVFADPEGGLYAKPRGRGILEAQGLPVGPDPNADGQLNDAGFKILHVQDIDYLTTVSTLHQALVQVRTWSAAHPEHIPLFILVELKDDAASPLLTTPVRFDAAQLDELDEAIRRVFQESELITPDSVRGSHSTLREAVTTDGWPTLADSRGKVMFALDNPGRQRRLYMEGHPSLTGRVLFASPDSEQDAEAAFFKHNDPEAGFEEIQRLVKAGFIIRTRADAATQQARTNDGSRRDRAFASGAQLISTDYPEPDERFSDYSVRFSDGRAVRANPLNGNGLPVADVDQPPQRQD